MFSCEYAAEIARHYQERVDMWRTAWAEQAKNAPPEIAALQSRLLTEKLREAEETLAACTPDEAEALRFLFGAMPLADFVDYPASLYLTYAKHAVFLWHEGPFAGRVPERLFTNYVLLHRVNNEDIADVRGLFYDRLKNIAGTGRPMEQTVLDINYWCAHEGTYRSTDGRTQNPATMLRTAVGRCGEESTFAATALRSVGIPARQVYAPWWSHCDDNHAWVEVWCDGEWHFFGACEPEEALDRGWFVGPASRAMMVHSRWLSLEEPDGERAGTKGAITLLNQLARYADTVRVVVHVRDEAGQPIPGMRVRFCVPNESAAGTIAVMTADENGDISLTTGRGDLYVCAGSENGLWGEAWVLSDNGAEFRLTVKAAAPGESGWHDIDFHAPVLSRRETALPEDQRETGAEKLREAARQRQHKADHLTDPRALSRALGIFTDARAREEAEKILCGARGNESELIRFLEWDAAGLAPESWLSESVWKLAMLKALREKDTWDITAEVLIDAAETALPYAGTVPDEVFFQYLACPRVMNEFLRPERAFLARTFAARADAVRKDPARLYRHMAGWFAPEGPLGYERTFTSARGVLRGGLADEASQTIFCVALYRALGIPARISPATGAPEYFDGTSFTAPGRDTGRDAHLTLRTAGTLKFSDWSHYSLERFAGGTFEHVWLWLYLRDGAPEELTLSLAPGVYRATTSNRLADGDQLLRQTTFTLSPCEEKTLTLALRDIPTERLIKHMPVTEAAFATQDGALKTLSDLAGDGRSLVVWLDVSREPTEHILNELYEQREAFEALKQPLYVVLRTEQELDDPTLRRTMAALPALTPLFSADELRRDEIAQDAGQDAGRLPLALIVQKGPECLYSEAGYRVGLADMLLEILSSKEG